MRSGETFFEGVHSSLAIARPARAVIVIRIAGTDVGELGDLPFRELAKDLETNEPLQLFVDARAASGPSVDVSSRWASWLRKHEQRFDRVVMLPGSRFVEFTAAFVRDFSGLRDRMQIVTDAATFDEVLRASCGGPSSGEP
jgi:hypothetical protein